MRNANTHVFSKPLTANKSFCQRWPHYKTATYKAKYVFLGLSHFSYINIYIYIYIDITNHLLADTNFRLHEIEGRVRYTQIGLHYGFTFSSIFLLANDITLNC